MKKQLLYIGVLFALLLTGSIPAMAEWWPSEPYGSFIRRFEVDKVWYFNKTVEGKKDWKLGNWNDDAQLVACPNYIAWQMFVWDNSKSGPDDYDVDWFEVSLVNTKTGEVHKIVKMDCLPESTRGSNNWEDNWKDDGNINITTDPNWYCNYNGNETRFCHKYLYQDWADGIQFAYLITKYSAATKRFIQDANGNIDIRVDGRYDHTSWSNYTSIGPRSTKWNTDHQKWIDRMPALEVSNIEFVENTVQGTLLKMTVGGVGKDNATYAKVYTTANGVKRDSVTLNNSASTSITMNTNWFDNAKLLNDGEYIVRSQQHRVYNLNRTGYHAESNKVIGNSVDFAGAEGEYKIPQVRLAHSVKARNNQDGTIQVTWEADAITQGRSYDTTMWVIQYCTDGKFQAPTMRKKAVAYNPTQTGYAEVLPVVERNNGNVKYWVRVCRNNKVTQRAPFYGETDVTVNSNYVGISKFIHTSDNSTANFEWTLTDGIWTKDMRLQLLKEGSEVMSEDKRVSSGKFSVPQLPFCIPIAFTLKVIEDTKTISKQEDTVVVRNSSPSKILYFKCSKGYYNNRVELKWEVDKDKQNFHQFVILRKEHNTDVSMYEMITPSPITKRPNVMHYSFTDEKAVPGVYYDYVLVGFTSCQDKIDSRDYIDEIGFTQPYGVVTGQVLFENGQAVNDVIIDMQGENLSKGASLEMKDSSYAVMNCAQTGTPFSFNGGAAEMYVQMDKKAANTPRTFIWQAGSVYFGLKDDTHLQLQLVRNGKTYTTTALLVDSLRWNAEAFNHVAMSYSHVNEKMVMQILVNGKLAASDTIAKLTCESGIGNSVENLYVGMGYDNGVKIPLKGYVDEIRMWKEYRSPKQIKDYYDCFMSGKEDGMSAYYRCDLILNNQTYDISGDGSNFNERHLTMHDVVTNTRVIPKDEQIMLRAHTKSSGDFVINAVPYSKQGTLYTLVPKLGVHQFSPATKTLIFNDNSSTHNSIDFVDISSFKVSGKVVYAGGNYPAEGIQFKVDGVLQLSKKGGAVMSDEDGHFELSVPVGVHTVQATLAGHTLTNDGFLTSPNGKEINFQNDISDITIQDSTRVRFIGRICGGAIQAAKPIGFSQSQNNLGDGLYLRLEHPHPDKYKLSETVRTETYQHKIPSIYALDSKNPKRKATTFENKVEYSDKSVTIYVNDSTGEFFADVPPITYTIRSTIPHYGNISEHGEQISFVGLTPVGMLTELYKYKDSIVTRIEKDSLVFSTPEVFTDTVYFKRRQVFMFQAKPILDFYQVGNDGKRLKYFGMDAVTVRSGRNFKWVQLYDSTKTTDPYALKRPLYKSGTNYTMVASLCEIYHRYDKQGKIIYSDSVPTMDAIFRINNTMTKQRETALQGKNGIAVYTFQPSEPNISKAEGQLSMRVEYNKNKSTIGWLAPFTDGFCYYTGMKKTSGDFITAGPNNLVTILRDPPGTGSYAYLDKGHSIQKDMNYTYSSFESGKLGLDIQYGFDFFVFAGLGIMVGAETFVAGDVKLGWEHSRNWSYKNNLNTTFTTNQRISTSSEEVFVGSGGDVFVGTSSNYSLATAKIIQMVETDTFTKYYPSKYSQEYARTTDGKYVLALSEGVSCGQQFNTTFAYTQSDIINEEIPRLEKLLRKKLLNYSRTDSAAYAQKSNTTGETFYMLKPGYDSTQYEWGAQNTYYMIAPNKQDSITRISGDTVLAIKGWIDRWKWCLGLNEYQKWKAYQDRDKGSVLVNNYSISGGATLSMSETYSTSRGYSYVYENKNGFFLDEGQKLTEKSGIYFGGSLLFEEHAGNDKVTSKQTTSSYTHTKGFVLAPNGYERLSVDVLHEHDWNESKEKEWYGSWEKDPNTRETDDVKAQIKSLQSYPSYIFYTRGGQTCCPYEPEVKAKYIELYLKEEIRLLDSIGTEDAKKSSKKLKEDLDRVKGKQVTINGPTLSIDKPELRALKTYVEGVPSGETAYVPIQMRNASESNTERPYYLVFKESSNTKGLAISVDGTGIGTGLTGGSGVSFLIPAGTTLNKTLAITKGSALDYDDIKLYLIAYCNSVANKFAIKDSCSISVHFTPSCTGIDIKLPTNGWVYNTSLTQEMNPLNKRTEHYLPIELTNFDINYTEFDHIELQYKPSSDNNNQWRKVHYFYGDTAKMNAAIRSGKSEAIVSLCKGGTIQYKLFLDEQDDQQYDIRAVTYCNNGKQLLENYSDVVTGVKDMYQPRLFGSAKPANGILGINDEVEFTFNEPISGGKLTYNNFTVSGLLDEAPSDRNISVHTDGQGEMKTEASLMLKNQFTLEGYFRQGVETGEQTLFSVGQLPHQIQLMMDKGNDKMLLKIGAETTEVEMQKKWQKGVWNHVALTCKTDATNTKTITIMLNLDPLRVLNPDANVQVEGKLVVGSGWIGDIDQVRVWTEGLSDALLRERQTIRYNNATVNLLCCYNMDENEGYTLEDASGGHTMAMNEHCTWTVPEGRGLYFGGNKQYALLPMSEGSFRKDQDYTVEFWFRAAPGKSETLLTTGRMNNANTDYTFTVGINSIGRLYITSGVSYTEISPSLFTLDDTWHHFTFSVSRSNGFARAYIDAQLIATIEQDKVGGLAASEMMLGAMIDKYEGSIPDSISSFYTGYLDEIRVWNCYRPQYQLCYSHMEKPDSLIPELVCYYPFERYKSNEMGISGLVFSLENFRQGKSKEQIILKGAKESNEAAPVATTSAKTRLDHTGYTFTPSENGIIFSLTKSLSIIEHCFLTFTAKDVMDVNGNKMLSPLSWTVYVDRNPLVVDEKVISVTVPVGNAAMFDLTVSNRGGTFQPITLTGLPTWLNFTANSNVVYPAGKETIHFISSSSLPIGTHSATIYVVNADNVVIPVQVIVVVEGEAPAEFTDKDKYPYNMSILGRIEVDGIPSMDTRDMLLVYNNNGQCVGSAHTIYMQELDAYYVYLQVYSESSMALPLTYGIYDASTGKRYKANSNALVHTFQNNAIIGSPAAPAVFYNQKELYRSYDLYEGWNWISFNQMPTVGWKINDVFGSAWSNGDMIKLYNADAYADFSDKQKKWMGPLTDMDVTHLFAVYTANDRSFYTLGEPVNTAHVAIPIVNGWNGISYLPQVSLSVKEALSLFTEISNGDVIKSQTQFATYYNGVWVGSLETMHPGEGYMFNHKGKNTTLSYPSTYAFATAPARKQPIYHETTMSLIAKPKGIQVQDGDKLMAYNGDEMVGEAVMTKGVWYMSIAGDKSENILHFVYSGKSGQAVSSTPLYYGAHRIVGSPAVPQELDFSMQTSALVAYPSPAQAVLYYIQEAAQTYAIYTLMGEQVQSGKATGQANVESLPSGAYILEVCTPTQVFRTTFIKE